MDKIKVKVSSESFKVKPTLEDNKRITYKDFWNDNSTHNLSYKNISELIKNGHSFILAEFKKNCGNIEVDNIESISCLALDIDSKENPITMMEMISLVYQKFGIYPVISYRTFSDADFTRFRLIYRLENKIDAETYKTLYRAFVWKLEKYLDKQVINPNRIWAGTNKDVIYSEHDMPISFKLLVNLINKYKSKLVRDRNKADKERKEKYKHFVNNEIEAIKGDYIRKEYKEEVANYIISNIDLKYFIEKHFGGDLKRNGNKLTGCCPIHGGDNRGAFSIFTETNTYCCFTRCGSGNIITLAKMIYNVNFFSELVFILAKEYNLTLKEEWIKRCSK